MADLIKSFMRKRKAQGVNDFTDNILDCAIFVDSKYIIQQVNREALNTLGFFEPQIIGKRLDLILGRDFSSSWEDFRKILTKWYVRNSDVVLKKKDGTEFPVKMNVTPLYNRNNIVGWFILAKDMTWTRNLIRELARSRKELQQTVKELEQSRDELVQTEKLSFAGRMAASIAHEIRNPLNIIGMAVQQLHSGLRKEDPRREYTKVIVDHIDRVDRLITEFVNVARPPKLKMQWRNINNIIEEVLKLLQPRFQTRKVKLTKELEKDLSRIRIDEEHMAQAFTNILLNACDALPKRNGRISVVSRKDGNYIVVTFKNTGKSIPKKDLIRIFDPFFSTKKTGTGLGMSIAYGIIGSHRGTIGIESNKKMGTAFTVRLPI